MSERKYPILGLDKLEHACYPKNVISPAPPRYFESRLVNNETISLSELRLAFESHTPLVNSHRTRKTNRALVCSRQTHARNRKRIVSLSKDSGHLFQEHFSQTPNSLAHRISECGARVRRVNYTFHGSITMRPSRTVAISGPAVFFFLSSGARAMCPPIRSCGGFSANAPIVAWSSPLAPA